VARGISGPHHVLTLWEIDSNLFSVHFLQYQW
jgi:hypothetical protein